MFLSVVIPAYNSGKYVINALRSIHCQSRDDVEVIVVNDGSVDNTESLVVNYKIENPEFNLKLISIENGGLANARNVGLNAATGKYFINLDSDDYLENGIIEKLRDKDQEEEFDVCFYGFADFEEETGLLYNKYDEKFQFYSGSHTGYDAFLDKIARKIWICQGSACYRKQIILDNIIYNKKDINQGEDFYFIMRVLLCSKRVVSIPYAGVNIMFRNDSMMHTTFNLSFLQIFDAISLLKKYVQCTVQDKNYKEQMLLWLDAEYERSRLSIANKIIQYNGNKRKIKTLKEIKELIPEFQSTGLIKLNKKKKLESLIFNHVPYLYIKCVILYKKLKG